MTFTFSRNMHCGINDISFDSFKPSMANDIMTCLTARDCLCHRWSLIFSLQPSQIHSSLVHELPPSMNYHQMVNLGNRTDANSGAGTDYIIRLYVINCPILSFLWCVCRPMFVFLSCSHFSTVFLRFPDSEYTFWPLQATIGLFFTFILAVYS